MRENSPNIVRRNDIIYLFAGKNWFQYRETARLGAGAMGIVYKGIECDTGKPVAIKRVVDKYAGNPVIRSRARQEARLMFSHPNLVEMIGYCEMNQDSGPVFIISRFVKGENIDDFINNNVRNLPNPEHRICELFMPVLDALAYIHQKGIIHMDIKPSNIMIEQGRNVRLMDLGIANVCETINAGNSGMMGTPKYAAPEQFSDPEIHSQLTPATDIYEAGVTLYELISKENPFTAKTIIEAKEQHREIILKKTASISIPVYNVIKKATAINPKDRYQTANEMKLALRNALITEPSRTNYSPLLICLGLIAIVILMLIIFLV